MTATAAALPRVHVVLLNWNGWRDTIECLETLFRMDYPDFRVVVCDNASSDGSLDHIERWARGELEAALPADPRLRALASPAVPKPIATRRLTRAAAERSAPGETPLTLIETGGNLGFAGGNNVALRWLLAHGATGYAWLLNNDMVVAPDALRRMVERGEAGAGVGAVGATLLEYAEPDVVQTAAGGVVRSWQGIPRETAVTGLNLRDWSGSLPRVDFVSGGCLLAPLAVFGQVGVLDERYFMYGEDIDWSMRLLASGFSFTCAADAHVWHKDGRSSQPGTPFHDYHMVRSALLLVRKFHARQVPLAAAFLAYRCLLPKLVRRDPARLAAVWTALTERPVTAGSVNGGPQPLLPRAMGNR